jgi:ubiquinone/menaquinone biosynthesis C-methylase UbiE
MTRNYIHGYSKREFTRLEDQANCLNELLHHDSVFPRGSIILEAGCGGGSQTKIIAPMNGGSRFISIDIDEGSLNEARSLIKSMGIHNVEFRKGNIYDLNFPEGYFDHIFVCFVLEHLHNPLRALISLKKVLKKGGSITLIEGDHGSAYFYPESLYAQKAINAQVRLQTENGGNALIGRQLYPLLMKAGFQNNKVSPRMVYVDSSKPLLVEGFTKNTFTAMVEGIREKALNSSIIKERTFDRGIRDLYRTTLADGVFCYTFFKGIGYNI